MTTDVAPIYEFEAGKSLMGYGCKGHIPVEEFLCEVSLWHEDEIPADRVRHTYYRNVPSGEGGGMVYVESRGPGRGAYPVTVVDL
jgi:hypothetical protein